MADGESISIVIPSWREGPAVIDAVRAARAVIGTCEVVVAAAEEDPVTRARARAEGAIWIDSPLPCRGLQLRLGAAAASGDSLVFLHADTRLPANAGSMVREVLAMGGVVGGAFRLRFDRSHPVLGLLGALSRLSLVTSFLGDQVLFCSRSAYQASGGFRDAPLFEDVEFAKRLSRVGRLVRVPHAVTTSSRRFMRNGPMRQLLANAFMMAAYHVGMPPERLHALYVSRPRQ